MTTTAPDRADGQPRTGVRYMLQGRAVHKDGKEGPWQDMRGKAHMHRDLYAAIAAREEFDLFCKNGRQDEMTKLLGEAYKAFDLKLECRIIKRTIITTDEVVDETATVPLQGTV